jgi:hypothetical protein
VFEDRLTTEEDHGWFREEQATLLGKHFGGLAYDQVRLALWTAIVMVSRTLIGWHCLSQ